MTGRTRGADIQQFCLFERLFSLLANCRYMLAPVNKDHHCSDTARLFICAACSHRTSCVGSSCELS